MPQFIAEHTPPDLDDFTRGYLECAEWLLDESVNRRKLRGFVTAAVEAAKTDCADFQAENAADLAAYYRRTGLGAVEAGHDFWLTRNRHGAGFWDRGAGEIGERLADAARACGSCDTYVENGLIYLT